VLQLRSEDPVELRTDGARAPRSEGYDADLKRRPPTGPAGMDDAAHVVLVRPGRRKKTPTESSCTRRGEDAPTPGHPQA
jgi:hypothetical protein